MRYATLGLATLALAGGAYYLSQRAPDEIPIHEYSSNSYTLEEVSLVPQLRDDRYQLMLAYDGNLYPLQRGPEGPRLGSVEYLAENLRHPERVQLTQHIGKDFPDLIARSARDLWGGREDVIADIMDKLEKIIEGD